MSDTIHVFEKVGLGKAPFHFIRVEEKVFIAHPGAPARPGASCDFCYTSIKNCYVLQSADGHEFHVGSECVRKTGDKGIIHRVKREANQLKNTAKQKRNLTRVAQARNRLPHIWEMLTKQPHPTIDRKTLADYVEWMLQNAGMAGCLRAAKIIEKEDTR